MTTTISSTQYHNHNNILSTYSILCNIFIKWRKDYLINYHNCLLIAVNYNNKKIITKNKKHYSKYQQIKRNSNNQYKYQYQN